MNEEIESLVRANNGHVVMTIISYHRARMPNGDLDLALNLRSSNGFNYKFFPGRGYRERLINQYGKRLEDWVGKPITFSDDARGSE